MIRRDGTFRVRDGLALFRQSWLPEKDARATLVIVHGFAEHSSRHAWHAGQLAELGYAVQTFDLRGHGRSEGPRVYVHRFAQYAHDLDVFFRIVRAELPGRPSFVFGHSMGGLIAPLWAMEAKPGAEGLILSAPAVRVARQVFPFLRQLARIMSRWLPRLRLVRLGCRYLSRDRAVVEAFRRDPLVFHGRFPVRSGAEILSAGQRVLDRARALGTPLLILQGTDDRVVDPAGAEALAECAGSADKTLKRYDGLFHELLSEPERKEVFADLAAWLDARC